MLLDPGQPAVPGLVFTSEDHDRIARLKTFLEVPATDEEVGGQIVLENTRIGYQLLDGELIAILPCPFPEVSMNSVPDVELAVAELMVDSHHAAAEQAWIVGLNHPSEVLADAEEVLLRLIEQRGDIADNDGIEVEVVGERATVDSDGTLLVFRDREVIAGFRDWARYGRTQVAA